MAGDGVAREILAVPGFGAIRLTCTDPDAFAVFYAPEAGAAHHWVVEGRDPVDNDPTFSTDGNDDTGGGFSWPTDFIHLEGFVGAYTATRVLRVDYSVVREGTATCSYQARATIDANGA